MRTTLFHPPTRNIECHDSQRIHHRCKGRCFTRENHQQAVQSESTFNLEVPNQARRHPVSSRLLDIVGPLAIFAKLLADYSPGPAWKHPRCSACLRRTHHAPLSQSSAAFNTQVTKRVFKLVHVAASVIFTLAFTAIVIARISLVFETFICLSLLITSAQVALSTYFKQRRRSSMADSISDAPFT